jgi:hypothetical protein
MKKVLSSVGLAAALTLAGASSASAITVRHSPVESKAWFNVKAATAQWPGIHNRPPIHTFVTHKPCTHKTCPVHGPVNN